MLPIVKGELVEMNEDNNCKGLHLLLLQER